MILQFHAFARNTDPEGLGYVDGFASDADAAKFAEVAKVAGSEHARAQGKSSMLMTSDHSLIVVNVRRSTFINKTLCYRGTPETGEYAEINAAMGWK